MDPEKERKGKCMKKFLAIILTVALILCMAGCASNSTIQNVGINGTTLIVVDKETGVNYIFYITTDGGGMAPRYNADGTLYVSEVE